jgi:hypothetical protein
MKALPEEKNRSGFREGLSADWPVCLGYFRLACRWVCWHRRWGWLTGWYGDRGDAVLLGIEADDVIGLTAETFTGKIKKGRIRRRGLFHFG